MNSCKEVCLGVIVTLIFTAAASPAHGTAPYDVSTINDGGRQGEEGSEQHQITWGRPNTNTAYFDDNTATNVTAVVGQKAMLPCKVLNLDKRDVSWIRQRDLHILTVGIFTYTSDDRFQVYHPENSNEWFLEISSVTFRDAGTYECQVSTSPKIFLPVTLTVEVQQAKINGPKEIYIQNGSTIKLTCIVNTHAENVGSVTWYRDTTELDYDSPRGGVSLEIEKTPLRTTSKLFLTRAVKADSGNYTCAPQFADSAVVVVHVVNGEESAAVQTANSMTLHSDIRILFWCLLMLLLYHAAR
ncbi:kin of IRRE-like protein 1 [Macrobrachium nipponense]|uniref:kin of IRRE-like protein 1 n=1 Tax=Macrobrachium nipponense TaxID=159736 RepID=UPI0030C8AC4D